MTVSTVCPCPDCTGFVEPSPSPLCETPNPDVFGEYCGETADHDSDHGLWFTPSVRRIH
ncbi:hypothetical protein IMZ11_02730 [Microtetraspora sp. AC03309]|uniref:hypothetical protein n=1 Tax=Microtetraspora sp. AC03309 TaxID=2779376 RepID=UPI001E52EA92|nr:hypothetical protein [Microtetraspora sp. AC03309]MCC5574555.1 hypothetical protein [Microtetraspora sp. AC03309]